MLYNLLEGVCEYRYLEGKQDRLYLIKSKFERKMNDEGLIDLEFSKNRNEISNILRIWVKEDPDNRINIYSMEAQDNCFWIVKEKKVRKRVNNGV